MKLPIYQVDAFAERVFAGNPAAVVPLDAWLPDHVLQAIAAENNLSETAFFIRREVEYDLRWFMPLAEAPLCGHATLASAYIIFEFIDPSADTVRFTTREAGPLTVKRDGSMLSMDLPAQRCEPATIDDALVAALGARPAEVFHGFKWVARFETEAEVRALAPDFRAMAALEPLGVIATARGIDVDFVSRYFAPKVGVDEDPVTGSAHTVLTPFWAQRLGRSTMRARQISPRGGTLTCRAEGDRVVLGGHAVLYLEGQISV